MIERDSLLDGADLVGTTSLMKTKRNTMSKTVWRVCINYGSGYGWVPVRWAPIFDTKEEALEWARQDHGWESPVDVFDEEWEEDDD
jgi:beta-mannanase